MLRRAWGRQLMGLLGFGGGLPTPEQPFWDGPSRRLDAASATVRLGGTALESMHMHDDQPGLFDLPDRERPDAVERQRRGRNREAWACAATAQVTIIDPSALHEAAARARRTQSRSGSALISAMRTLGRCRSSGARDALNLLAWLIWPTDGMDRLLEEGASECCPWTASPSLKPLIERWSPGRSPSSSRTSGHCAGSLPAHTRRKHRRDRQQSRVRLAAGV